MNNKKSYLVLSLLAVVLCSSAFGQAKSTAAGTGAVPPGKVNPMLVGIDKLCVDFRAHPSVAGKNSQYMRDLVDEIDQKAIKAGFETFTPAVIIETGKKEVPILKTTIDMFSIDNGQRNIFLVNTTLSVGIYMGQDSSMFYRVDVWMRAATVEATSINSAYAVISKLALENVDALIKDYLLANQKGGKSLGAKTSGKASVKTEAAKYKFVASKNSRVFHNPECSSAKKILQENLVTYVSKAEATKTHKRACKRCKP